MTAKSGLTVRYWELSDLLDDVSNKGAGHRVGLFID